MNRWQRSNQLLTTGPENAWATKHRLRSLLLLLHFDLECGSTSPAFPKKLVSKTWVEEFEKTGAGWLQILSGSMAPLIQKWDRIYVEKVDLSKIHRGDIITFWRSGVLITHRVIKKMQHGDEMSFVERGDQYFTHSIISSSSVIGKVKQIKKMNTFTTSIPSSGSYTIK